MQLKESVQHSDVGNSLPDYTVSQIKYDNPILILVSKGTIVGSTQINTDKVNLSR